jgi:hypothetical protein
MGGGEVGEAAMSSRTGRVRKRTRRVWIKLTGRQRWEEARPKARVPRVSSAAFALIMPHSAIKIKKRVAEEFKTVAFSTCQESVWARFFVVQLPQVQVPTTVFPSFMGSGFSDKNQIA